MTRHNHTPPDDGVPLQTEEIHALAEGKLSPERAAQVRRLLLRQPEAMRTLVDAEAMLRPISADEQAAEADRRSLAADVLRQVMPRRRSQARAAVLVAAAVVLASLGIWLMTGSEPDRLASPRPALVSDVRGQPSQWRQIGVQLDIVSPTRDGLIVLVVNEQAGGLAASRMFPPVPAFPERDRWLSQWQVIPPDRAELYPTRSGVLVVVARADVGRGVVADEATIAALQARIDQAVAGFTLPLQPTARTALSDALRGFAKAVEVHWVGPE